MKKHSPIIIALTLILVLIISLTAYLQWNHVRYFGVFSKKESELIDEYLQPKTIGDYFFKYEVRAFHGPSRSYFCIDKNLLGIDLYKDGNFNHYTLNEVGVNEYKESVRCYLDNPG